MNERIAVENLGDIKDVFDRFGIDFWLDSGTLLGAVRDGKIIEWDSDVDLGVWDNDVIQITSTFPEFKKRGFDVFLNRKRAHMEIKRFGCTINVGLYHKKGDYAWIVWIVRKRKWIENVADRCINISNVRAYAERKVTFTQKIKYYSSLLPSALKQLMTDIGWLVLYRFSYIVTVVIAKHHFEELSNVSFYGMKFKIPSDVEKYLEYRYGSDWKTPNKKWIYYKDDRAINLDWCAQKLI